MEYSILFIFHHSNHCFCIRWLRFRHLRNIFLKVLRGESDVLDGHFGRCRLSYRDIQQYFHQLSPVAGGLGNFPFRFSEILLADWCVVVPPLLLWATKVSSTSSSEDGNSLNVKRVRQYITRLFYMSYLIKIYVIYNNNNNILRFTRSSKETPR